MPGPNQRRGKSCGPPAFEKGIVRKSWNQGLRVALIYPNSYLVGMANLGFQTVYRLFNDQPQVVCERVFMPARHPKDGQKLVSEESRRRMVDFDILAFSISFEADYVHLPMILDWAEIPVNAEKREEIHPLVMAGGIACFLNPEPIAAFIDCFLLGEAEKLVPDLLSAWQPRQPRQEKLLHLAHTLKGAYVPQFYHPESHSSGSVRLIPSRDGLPEAIETAVDDTFSQRPVPEPLISSHAALGAVCLIETGRGCPHGCRFCSAGFIYRPPRYKTGPVLSRALDMASKLSRQTGLVGTALGELPALNALCQQAQRLNIRLAFSSLRADALTPALLAVLAQSGVKTATIAPEAGSERLRRVINKGLTEDVLMRAVSQLVATGIPNLKLYFMVGLPEETETDIEALIDLCRQLKKQFLAASRPRGRLGTVTVSVAPFVPKPATPFQWVAMNDLNTLKLKLAHIRQGLKNEPNLRLHLDNPLSAIRQALLARGDRRLADVIVDAYQSSDGFRRLTAQEQELIPHWVHRTRSIHEPLAWNIVHHRVKQSYLLEEYSKSRSGHSSVRCNLADCGLCGACKPSDESKTCFLKAC